MNKEMRRERTKQEFIHASKEIIEKLGIDQVSARRVGELSGYSYATIYNYFNDINHLLQTVSADYKLEIYKYITEPPIPKLPIDKLNLYITRYMAYMMMNKSVFTLLCLQEYTASEDILEFEELLRGTLHEMKSKLSFNTTVELIHAFIQNTILEFHTGKKTESEMTIINETLNLIKGVIGS